MPSARYWHAVDVRGSHLSAGLRVAEPAREIERDQNLLTGLAARLACRRGSLRATTEGIAPGNVQRQSCRPAAKSCGRFPAFRQANPKPCSADRGVRRRQSAHPALGLDLDIRTDLPGYRVWQDGEPSRRPPTSPNGGARISKCSFVIGCSYSFRGGPDRGRYTAPPPSSSGSGFPCTAPTSTARRPAHFPARWWCRCGRCCTAARHPRGIQITSRFPAVHGAPVHVGLPEPHRHQRSRQTSITAIRSKSEPTSFRCSGPVSHAPVGHRASTAAVRDHACAGRDADHRPQEPAVRGDIERKTRAFILEPSGGSWSTSTIPQTRAPVATSSRGIWTPTALQSVGARPAPACCRACPELGPPRRMVGSRRRRREMPASSSGYDAKSASVTRTKAWPMRSYIRIRRQSGRAPAVRQ